jgi:phosphatidylinositol alpha-1,6-mannosyltransferase
MKRLLWVTLHFPPAIGGVQEYTFQLLRRMPNDSVVVLCPPSEADRQWDARQPFTIRRRNFFTRVPVWPRWILLFFHVFYIGITEKISVFHAGEVLPTGTVVMIIAWLLRRPYVVTTHGMDILLPQQFHRKQWIAKKVYAHARAITVLSEYAKGKLQSQGVDSKKMIILPPSTDLHPEPQDLKTAEALRSRFHLENKRVVFSLSRLVRRKGHDRLIPAFARIAESVPDVQLVIGGDGPDRSYLTMLAHQHHLSDRITFLGRIREEEKRGWLQLCTFFVLIPRLEGSADVEGFGIVYLEAAAFEKTSLASTSGGVPEAVVDGETGVLVNPEEVEAIATKLSALLADSQRCRTLGRQANARRLLRSWDRQAQILQQLYQSLE